MDPESITLIMEALKFGSAEIAAGRLNQKGIEQWNRLNTAIKGIFVGQAKTQIAFAEYENDPDVWVEPLKKMLMAVKTDQDKKIMALAQKVKELEQALQERSSEKHVINADRGTVQGVVQVNYGEITMNFQNGEQVTVPFLVPPKPKKYNLVGREKLLEELKQRLIAGEDLAFNGLPGVGKSALAVELAHDLEVLTHFKQGILWAGLGREPNISTQLMRWGTALGIPSDEMAKLETIGAKVDEVRKAIGKRRMLLVVDDAWQAHAALAFRLGGPNCAHLVTTRFFEIAERFASNGTQVVPELDHVDGLVLLKELASDVVGTEPKAAEELVQAVGGLPLGLILMGNHLKIQGRNSRRRRIRKALDKLKQAEERVIKLEEPQVAAGRHPSLPEGASISLDAIIEVSYEALDADEVSRVSRLTLRAISVFPPKPNTFSEEAAEVVADQSAETLDTLEDYGLLEGSRKRYELHQTIADYASLKCSENERVLFEQRAATYFAAFAQQHSRSGYKVLEEDWRNISHSMEFAFKNEQWQALLDGVQGLTDHNLGVVGFMDARGYWSNARELLPKTLEGAKALDDRQVEASILTKMGAFAFRQSEFDKTEEYLQKSLGILEELPSSQDVVLQRADCYQFMAELELRRNPQAGLEWVERGVTELDALNLKADVVKPQKGYFYLLLARLSGRMSQLGEAITHAKEAVDLLPHRSSAGITAFRTLSSAYSLQGNIKKSLVYQYKQLEVVTELGDSRQIAHSLMNIGLDEGNSGNFEVAIDNFKKALKRYEEMGHVNGKTIAHNNLGMFYTVLGEDQQAKKDFETALGFTENHPFKEGEAINRAYFGSLLIYQEKFDEAARALRRAKKICVQLKLDDLKPVVLYRQAQVAQAKGEYDEALTLITESLQIAQKVGHSLEEGIAWSIKGKILDAMQRFDEAEEAHQTSLNKVSKYRYEQAQSQQALAEHFIMRDEMLSDRAKSLLTEALATFERLGAKRDIAQTKALLHR